MRRLVLPAAAAAAILAAAPAAAATGVLAGTLTGFPAKVTVRDVSAVVASTGEVAGVAQTSGTKVRIAVAPGQYLLAADARDRAGRRYGGTSDIVTVASRGLARLRVRAQPAAASRWTPLARAASSLDPGSVITVEGIVVDAPPGSGARNLSLDGPVLSLAFDGCSAHGVRFVDRSPQVKAAQRREQELADSGRLDGPFQTYPLEPQFQVTGHGMATADGNVTVVLDVVDLATGAVVGHYTAEGKTQNLEDVVTDAVEAFSEGECHAPIPTRCPRINGQRLACVTSIGEGGGGTVSQRIDGGSCPDPNGYSRAAADLRWGYDFKGPHVLGPGASGRATYAAVRGAYAVDAQCTTNSEHCQGGMVVESGLGPWSSGDGSRPGRWRLKIPVLAAVNHPCSTSAIDDPAVRESATLTVTLRSNPKRQRRRVKVVPFAMRRSLGCGAGCKDSYDLNGIVVIRGEW